MSNQQYMRGYQEGMQEGSRLAFEIKQSVPNPIIIPQEQSRYEVALELYKEWGEVFIKNVHNTKPFHDWLEEKIPIYPEVIMESETLERIKE